MGVIFLFIIVLILVGFSVGIVFWITGGASTGHGEMSCGSCGYPVRGNEGLYCPECGADLRQVGIVRQKSGATRSMGMLMVIGFGAILLIGGLGSVFFLASDSAPSSPATLSQPVPKPSMSPSPVHNADGSITIHNPDGSQIVTRPDGSKTLIQPDGTMTTFDKDGVGIPNPEPNADGTEDGAPTEGETP